MPALGRLRMNLDNLSTDFVVNVIDVCDEMLLVQIALPIKY